MAEHSVTSSPAQPRPPPAVPFLLCHIFLSTMSWPTGVIRNSKFSKQFSVFSVYMLGFIMVHGQNRFSTSRTLKLVRFLSLASLCSVGPTQTAALRCSVQPRKMDGRKSQTTGNRLASCRKLQQMGGNFFPMKCLNPAQHKTPTLPIQ